MRKAKVCAAFAIKFSQNPPNLDSTLTFTTLNDPSGTVDLYFYKPKLPDKLLDPSLFRKNQFLFSDLPLGL